MIKRIAIVGGSGSSFLESALDAKADAFISADISYHTFHRAENNIMLIDPGHYEMEQFVPEGLADALNKEFPNGSIDNILVSKIVTNPVHYYPNTGEYKLRQSNNLIS
jgi:putative NIF3 family GTP cyclohydrolase 1 type 2